MNMHDLSWVERGVANLLSVVIPAFNEAPNLAATLPTLIQKLTDANIDHEILVINDNSTDNTVTVLEALQAEYGSLRYINNVPPNGFGLAVRCGLQAFKGDAVIIMMADGSDSPEDVVAFYQKLQEGYDCVFGSRFIQHGKTVDYPVHKMLINRIANHFVRFLFQFRYNDITNAFKCYRRHVIAGLTPFLAHHFNLTVELPLKAIIRGYRYAVLPNAWYNRKEGVSKLKIREMGSRYLFIVLYCLIERLFSRGDYKVAQLKKGILMCLLMLVGLNFGDLCHANTLSSKPIIGVLLNDGGKGDYSDYPWYAIRQNYGKILEENGAIPIYLGFHMPLIADYLTLLDGLVLTGGDFPTPPAGFTTGVKGTIDADLYPRTAFELTLIQKAYEKNIPVLAICGGMQDMVVAQGGVLIENLAKNVHSKINHRHENREQLVHGVTLLPDSQLQQLLKSHHFQVNSNHRSGIKIVPPSLKVNAKASDGVIEGVEAPKNTFFLGVMWHPEFLLTPQDKILWRSFIQASVTYRLKRLRSTIHNEP